MKHSWLRLFSSVYILLVSVLLIVISAYAWMVISSSPSTSGAGFGVAGKELWNLPEFEFDEVWDGDLAYEDKTTIASLSTIEKDSSGAYIIRTGEELWTMVNYINGTKETGEPTGDITMKIVNSIDMASETTEFDLDSIYVDGYNGVGKITVIGAKTDETGAIVETGLRLKKPLFSGGFAGNSAIVIENITIANSNITSTNTTGSGAFIDYVDAMQEITLTNCHLKNSTVTGGTDSRTGGLVGYITGYSKANDGPVKTYATITNCSVENSTINSENSAGGIIGHAGASDWTYTVVEGCTVTNTKLSSTDDGGWRVGEIVGTANVGELIVKNCDTEKVELAQINKTFPDGQDKSYGRLALGTTGNYTIINENKAELWGVFTQLAADNYVSNNQTWILHDKVTLGSEIRFQTVPAAEGEESENRVNINIIGADSSATESGKAEITLNSVASGYAWQGQARATSGFNFDALNDYVNDVKASTTVTFSNIVFNNNKTADDTCETTANRGTLYTYAYSETVSYTDCTFNGGVVTYGDATFTSCSFTEDDSNMYCLFLDNQYGGIGYAPTYIVTDCTFNGNSSSYGGLKVADDSNVGANLRISGSSFENIVNKSAIYVNGLTNVIASDNTFADTCTVGDIGFKGDSCTYNGSEIKAGDYRIEDLGNPTSQTSGDTGGTSASTTTTTTTTTTAPAATTSDGATTTTASADVTAATTTVPAETTTTAVAETTSTTASADVTTTTAVAETTTTTASADVTTTTAVAETTTTTASADVTTTTAAAETTATTTASTEATTATEATTSLAETTTPSEEPTASSEETTEPTIEE